MLEPPLASGVLDEDPAHRFGRRGKKMAATIPGLLGIGPDETNIRLMDQGGCLQRLASSLVRQPGGGEPRSSS